jgi:putative Mg2+ transporter-C (MgtC) family protein
MILNDTTPVYSLDTEVLLRLGVAALIGLALGLDRELRGHAAGLRTHGLICFAAAVMTVSLLSLYNQLGGAESNMDPIRIFEGVGAFIGIAAAGLIVVTRGEVHNLTTAVNLWLAAVVGVACGAAQWPLVAVASLVGVVIITLVGIAEKRWLEPRARKRKAEHHSD